MLRKAAIAVIVVVVAAAPGCVSPLDEVERQAGAPTFGEDWVPPGAHGMTPGRPSTPSTSSHPLDIGEDSTLADCLSFAVRNSPELEAAFHRWRAAVERGPQVTSLPDPRLSYGYFIDEVETRVGPQQHRISVAQVFPWFGKLELRGEVADRMARAELDRLEVTLLELLWEVERVYLELYYLRSAIEITRENVALLAQFEQIARARYAVAAATHPDVVRVQVELGKLSDRLQQMVQRRRPLAARLNAMLDRRPDAAVPWPASIPDHAESIDPEALAVALKAASPRLRALEHEMERHRAASRLARKEAYPDVTLMLDYIVTGDGANRTLSENGDDPVIAGVSVNVPIWREKYEAAVREAISRRLATASRRLATENDLVAQLEAAIFDYRDGQRRRVLFRDYLVPKGREALDSSARAYQNAKLSFIDLLDAERVLLELQLAERRAQTDVAVARARIEMLVGGGADALRDGQGASERLQPEDQQEDTP